MLSPAATAVLLLFGSRWRDAPLSSTLLASSAADEAALGSARARLFDDQHKSMNREAELEQEILEPNMKVMQQVSKKKQKQLMKKSAGVGFGGTKPQQSQAGQKVEVYANVLEEDGVVLVPSVLSAESAQSLRDCVINEIEVMRDTIRQEPEKSVSLFYVPAQIHFSTPRGYVLLPFQDSAAGEQDVGALVRGTRELLGESTMLSKLFSRMCDGEDSQLYDYCVLRTEAGAARQVIHSDTPYQKTPGLFCAFVALQDVSFEMGGTLFLPRTHDTPKSKPRRNFDMGGDDKEKMLRKAKPQYTMLKAGDAALFDMRILHAGLANQLEGGADRYLMAVTFQNPKAEKALGHKPNLRPGYAGRFTLGEFQQELARSSPFDGVGNGLIE